MSSSSAAVSSSPCEWQSAISPAPASIAVLCGVLENAGDSVGAEESSVQPAKRMSAAATGSWLMEILERMVITSREDACQRRLLRSSRPEGSFTTETQRYTEIFTAPEFLRRKSKIFFKLL